MTVSETPTAAAPRSVSLLRLTMIVAVFTLLGPLFAPLIFVVFFTLVGFFALGPASIFVAFMYLFFWMPFLYAFFGIPFLLTGVLFAAAVRLWGGESIAWAMLAAAAAFPLYFAVRFLVTGTFSAGPSALGPNVYGEYGVIGALAAFGSAGSWWLVRDKKTYAVR
jgi:hypothetical protein